MTGKPGDEISSPPSETLDPLDTQNNSPSPTILIRGAIWTIGAFGTGQLIRFATNVFLARLLAPELFGVMQIVYSLRTAMELISDVGLGQNIIYNSNANEPDFYNTAWTLQVIRGVLLWILSCAAAIPAARFFHSPVLALVIPISTFTIVLGSLSSASRFLLQKRMKYHILVTFETIVALCSSGAQIVLAYFSPTIWALVFGTLIGTATATIGSHFLLKDVKHKLAISKRYAQQIFRFGKWIFASSIIYFLSTNFDRLYLAKVVSFQVLGVYGIARSIAELISLLILRLGNSVIFPFIASHSQVPTNELRAQLSPIRMKFLCAASFVFSLLAAIADSAIGILYDQRYQAAAWMLPVLLIGAWFAILCNLNEATLLGLGKPSYSAVANGAKFGFLLVGLTISVPRFGISGGVMVVAVSDLFRYLPIFVGQIRNRFSFGAQDFLASLLVFALFGFFEWVRYTLGYGTSIPNLFRYF